MMKKTWLAALALATLTAVAPHASFADQHCSGVFIFSGPRAMVENAATPGLNLGANGCNAEAANVDTNYLTPGADALRVGASGGQQQVPSGGKIKFGDGEFQTITFSWEPTRGRWLSNLVVIPASARSVTAQATAFDGQGMSLQKITYAKLG